MTSSEMISLRAGDLALDLAPTIGGSIARFAYRGMPLMRPPSAADIASRSPRALASYPLVPFSNRIVGGCFRFDGRDYRLALNFGDHPHAIHGNGWQREWRVEAAETAFARIVLDHDPARDGAEAWPFAYRAEQEFLLSGDTLTVVFRVPPDLDLDLQGGRQALQGDLLTVTHDPLPDRAPGPPAPGPGASSTTGPRAARSAPPCSATTGPSPSASTRTATGRWCSTPGRCRRSRASPRRWKTLEGARRLALHDALRAFDRRLGYPFAWYFHMLTTKAVPFWVARQVMDDAREDYACLPERDLAVVHGWLRESYGF